MMKFATRALLAAMMAGTAASAFAADLYEPPVVDVPPQVVVKEVSHGGWYIRGDIDYHATRFRDAHYWTYEHDPLSGHITAHKNGKLDGDLDESFSAGFGVGYQVNKNLRTDVTLDHFFEADFEGSTSGICAGGVACTSKDETSMSAWLLLANAYLELGTYHGFTPYVGAGIGGAHIDWDSLKNTTPDGEFEHDGHKSWRFAYALMAGTSYCLTKNLNLDLGYRFSKVEGGKMFDFAAGAGPGDDEGFHVHEARAGLRYQFGGGNPACGAPEVVAYEPEPLPPVYK